MPLDPRTFAIARTRPAGSLVVQPLRLGPDSAVDGVPFPDPDRVRRPFKHELGAPGGALAAWPDDLVVVPGPVERTDRNVELIEPSLGRRRGVVVPGIADHV